ncbi:copper chaperone PCu(A)C [Acetobacter syzygii]|uniref:copper chaperone PCu(A)C n=1 Tax=Acetobacter syzygii TaxID=146476 RepID=UPI0039EA6898
MKSCCKAILTSLALLSLTTLLPAHAEDNHAEQAIPGQVDAQKDITVSDGAFHMPAAQTQGLPELYFTLTNNSHSTHLLTSVTSPACKQLVGYHTDQENTVGMRHLFQHLALPEATTLVFSSAGYHMLCMEPVAQVLSQPNVQVSFQFLGGSSKSISATIIPASH